MEAKFPEARHSGNVHLRKLGFHAIEASEGLDFMKCTPPEGHEVRASGSSDFMKSSFRRPGFHGVQTSGACISRDPSFVPNATQRCGNLQSNELAEIGYTACRLHQLVFRMLCFSYVCVLLRQLAGTEDWTWDIWAKAYQLSQSEAVA